MKVYPTHFDLFFDVKKHNLDSLQDIINAFFENPLFSTKHRVRDCDEKVDIAKNSAWWKNGTLIITYVFETKEYHAEFLVSYDRAGYPDTFPLPSIHEIREFNKIPHCEVLTLVSLGWEPFATR